LDNAVNVHVTYVPYIGTTRELKSKPTQHSVKELRSLGLQPEILLCRAEQEIPGNLKEKIALFSSVTPDAVFSAIDSDLIYEVPLLFHKEGMDAKIVSLLGLCDTTPDLHAWTELIGRIRNPKDGVTIAIVANYVESKDSYKSLVEAVNHAGYGVETRIDLKWVEAKKLESQPPETQLVGCHGILIPGGFGIRGMKGMIAAAQYARECNIPFFGIGLGMHTAIVEFARNVAMLDGADSAEYDENPQHKVICNLGELTDRIESIGTTRLGSSPCLLQEDSLAAAAYQGNEIHERHRNRFEFNQPKYRSLLETAGMAFTGLSSDQVFVEIIELPKHRFFLGCQFHPEYKSKPLNPHPLFSAFLKACKYVTAEQ
jgi:CTP synthase